MHQIYSRIQIYYIIKTPFPLKWEILLILGIFAIFEKYIF
jgi:hypothetical protein